MKENNESKENLIVLQEESHLDDLGVVFVERYDGVYCCIDCGGGEMIFKLNFLQSKLEEQRERIREEIEQNYAQHENGEEKEMFDRRDGYNTCIQKILSLPSLKLKD